MEDDEDDFYGTNGDTQTDSAVRDGDDGNGSEQMDEDSDNANGAQEDSDDDSIDFQLDNEKVVEQVEQEAARRQAGKQPPEQRHIPSQATESRPSPQATNTQTLKATTATSSRPTTTSTQQAQPSAVSATLNTKPASSYPPIRSSTIDFEDEATLNPPFPPSGNKPVRDLDLDADIADKTWRMPGVDQTDWFNYGFDEFTWATYALRQRELRGFADTTAQQMKDQFGMMGLPVPGAMPGAPPNLNGAGQQQNGQPSSAVGQLPGGGAGLGAMGNGMMPQMPTGLPDEQQMQQMMQQMMASGMDLSQMGLDDFMRFSGMAMPGAGGGGGPGGGGPGGGGPGAGTMPQGPQGQSGQQWGQSGQAYGGGQAGRGGRGGRRW